MIYVIQVRVRVNEMPEQGNFVLAELHAPGMDRSPANNVDMVNHFAETSAEAPQKSRLFMPILAAD
jgi:hypothetical protein